MRILSLAATCVAAAAFCSSAARAENTTLTIESWRTDDIAIWQDKIIPAFEKTHPGITVRFSPTAPTEYNAALNAKLDAGSAGDLITCRPFDASLALYNKQQLVSLNDLPGIEDFSSVAKAAWTTDDGKTTFCVPMASVIHGFIYNADIFAELGLSEPKTNDEFFKVLEAIKIDGRYVPIALGTVDQWEAATMGYQNIGPTYWKGEDGRLALVAGKQKLTDEGWAEPYRVLKRWSGYLGDGYKAQTYPDSQNLFTLGRAAIFPAGSWEIGLFSQQAQFKLGAFPPPVVSAGDTCYISDHPDIGLGLNSASKNVEAARTFLSWVASEEFATLYSNALPGFFALSKHQAELDNALANKFVSWRNDCQSTVRSTYAVLSRGTPNLENETWNASSNVINGVETSEAAAKRLQDGLDSWYKPAK